MFWNEDGPLLLKRRMRRVSAYQASLMVMTWAVEQRRAGMTRALSQHHWAQTEDFSLTHGSKSLKTPTVMFSGHFKFNFNVAKWLYLSG